MEVSVKIFWYGVERYGFWKVFIAAMNNILKQKPIEQIGGTLQMQLQVYKSFSGNMYVKKQSQKYQKKKKELLTTELTSKFVFRDYQNTRKTFSCKKNNLKLLLI